jgi:regulator of RNase E activity RraA
MAAPLTAVQLEGLRRYDSCAVASAIDRLGGRLPNEGYTNATIRCMTPRSTPLVAYAATVKIRCSNPQPEGHAYVERTDFLEYIRSVPEPRVVAIQDADEHPGTGAFPGEVRASIWRALGCIGAITNGSVHDLAGIQKMDFHLFATGLTVFHAYAHLVEFGRPVEIGGLRICSGDLLHADGSGVLSVPVGIADKIPETADAILRREQRILEHCRSQDFSLEKLCDVLKAPIQ